MSEKLNLCIAELLLQMSIRLIQLSGGGSIQNFLSIYFLI